MLPSLYIAKTGLDAQQMRMGVISNNLANVSTTGFKRDRAQFEDLLYQTIRQPGAQSSQDTTLPSGYLTGTGVRAVAVSKVHSQGNIIQTENPLDVAIQGRGYFQVLKPDGAISYTRDGAFQVNEQGQLVTASGYHLQPALSVTADTQSITIGTDGTVSIRNAGSTSVSQIGTLQLADFINPAGLQPVGENMYVETAASGNPQVSNPGLGGVGQTYQGSLESSNVNVVEELVSMIEGQRAYEINSKAVSTSDQMLQYLNNNI